MLLGLRIRCDPFPSEPSSGSQAGDTLRVCVFARVHACVSPLLPGFQQTADPVLGGDDARNKPPFLPPTILSYILLTLT